jgi:hypothetical protein
MNELWEELKNEIESADNREAAEIIALIRSQLKEIELDSMSLPEFLERQNNEQDFER